jgi:Protein of unknown function (DUF2911)
MKYILLVSNLLFLSIFQVIAQLTIPQLSPAAKVEQQVGLDKVIVTYNRPSLKGRKLLGQSDIPYGKVWRMGANEVTTLELKGDMIIEGKLLSKGKYAFVAIPEANEWTIIINKDDDQWGVYGYKENKDVMRFKVKAEVLPQIIETLTFTFEDLMPTSSSLVFKWENVQFKIGMIQDSDKKIMAEIKAKTSKTSPDLEIVMEAAEYYLMMNRDLPQAFIWINQVLEKNKSPFRYNLKAQIAHKMNNCEVAIEAAKAAIPLAEKSKDEAAKSLSNSIITKCK